MIDPSQQGGEVRMDILASRASYGAPGRPWYAPLVALILCVAFALGHGSMQPAAYAQAPALTADALMKQGVQLARKGQYKQAVAALERALEQRPKSRDIRYNLGLALYNSGEARRAAAEFSRILDDYPEALEARRGLGLAQLALNRYAAAAKSLAVVAAKAPEDATALGGLGKAYLALGKPEKALGPLRAASTFRPQVGGLAYEWGRAALAVGLHSEAKIAFGRALKVKPDSVGAARGLAETQLALGETAMAVESLRRFAALPVPDPEVFRLLAQGYDTLGLAQEALDARKRLAELLPPKESAALQLELGEMYAGKQQWEQALPYFEAAIAGDPSNAQAHVSLAKCYHALGSADKELARWRKAMELAPRDMSIGLGLAGALGSGDQNQAALAVLDQALTHHPNHADALQTAAQIAREMGELRRAEEYLRRILATDPRDFLARRAVVDVLLERGQPVKALVEAGEALRAPNPLPEAYETVATIAEKLGNRDLAITQWRKLSRISETHALQATLNAGALLVEAHRVPEAIDDYREAIHRHPESLQLRLALAAAYQAVGRDRQAASLLRPLVDLNPELTAARVALAESLSWLGQHVEAREQMGEVLAAGALDERACRVLALVCRRGARQDEAIRILVSLLPDEAPAAVVVELLTGLYEETGRTGEGGRRLLAVFDGDPSRAEIGLAGARLLGQSGDLVEAEQVLRGIARRPELRVRALRETVRLQAELGAPERAVEPLRRLLETDPSTAWVIATLAEIETRPDFCAEARDTLVNMADSELGSPGFWFGAAQLAGILQRTPLALARMQGLASQAPSDPGLACGVAALALVEGRPQVGLEAIRAVPNDQRDDRVLLHVLARTQAALGQGDAAMVSLRAAMKAGPAQPEDYMLYAELEIAARREEQALWHLVQALNLNPGAAPARASILGLIEAGTLPPRTILEGLKLLYAYRPDTPVVHELVGELAKREDARDLCEAWLTLHPQRTPEPLATVSDADQE